MKNLGFTLLETIIYCALFSVLMTSAIVTVYALMESNDETQKQTNVIAEASFITEKLTWAFSNATEMALIDMQTIRITRPDLLLQSPLILEFKNDSIFLTRGNSEAYILVKPEFAVSVHSITINEPRVTIIYSLNETVFRFDASIL